MTLAIKIMLTVLMVSTMLGTLVAFFNRIFMDNRLERLSYVLAIVSLVLIVLSLAGILICMLWEL